MHINLYVDGGARGNPGPSGIGAVLKDANGKTLKEFSKSIGIATNNAAEYSAVIYGLQESLFLKADTVDIYVDSELVAKQLQGKYKVKSSNMKFLAEQVLHLFSGFKKVSVNHIPREKNKEADKLVNKILNLNSLF